MTGAARATRRPRSRRWRSRAEGSLLLGFVTWTTDRLRRPIELAGVDFPALREILRTKFLIQLRASRTGGPMADVVLVLTLLAAWFMGILAGIAAIVEDVPAEAWIGVSQLALAFFLLIALAGQYASLLVDATDIRVLAPHPVSDRTLFAARLAHVFVFTGMMGGCFSFGSVMLGAFTRPPLAVLIGFPLICLLTTCLVTGGVSFFFALVLRLFGPTQFQRIALWVQIVVGAGAIGGPNLLMRVLPWRRWLGPLIEDGAGLPVLRWLPPLSSMGLYQLLAGEWSAYELGRAALAIALPVLAVGVTLAFASRHFIAGLAGTLELGGTPRRGWRPGPFSRLGRRLATSGAERAGYDLAVNLSRREPNFLRAVLPLLIGFEAMIVGSLLGFRLRPDVMPTLLTPICFFILLLQVPILLEAGQFSENHEARWLVRAAPVRDFDPVLRGGIRGLLFGMLAPAVGVVLALVLLLSGPRQLPSALLAIEMLGIVSFRSASAYRIGVPFTRSPSARQSDTRNVGRNFLLMFGVGLLTGVHVLLTLHWLSTILAAAVGLPLLVRAYRSLDRARVPPDLLPNAS